MIHLIEETSTIISIFDKYKHIYIYGAGKLAENVISNFPIEKDFSGVVVSKKINCPEMIDGYKVREVDDIDSVKDSAFILALSEKYWDEVISNLINKFGNDLCIYGLNGMIVNSWKYYKKNSEKNSVENCNFIHSYKYSFIDRSKGSDKLCYILSGYKPILWEYIFKRINNYKISDMDVCVISAGLFSQELYDICENYGWSYLHTEENNPLPAENTAIFLHPNAELIFKLDEDIFITEDYFNNMIEAYNHAKLTYPYHIGGVAPLIPLNSYGCCRILEKLKLAETFESLFYKPFYGVGEDGSDVYSVMSNKIARFMWGEGGYIPSIDYMNDKFKSEDRIEKPCPVHFSIGAILFSRTIWHEMLSFDLVDKSDPSGLDERIFTTFCAVNSRPLLVSENIVVGHFSYGNQFKSMCEYLDNHIEAFQI